MPFKKLRTLPAQKVNPGLRASYRRVLDGLMRKMGREAVKAVLAEYERMEDRIAPEIAQDARRKSPAEVLSEKERLLLEHWRRRFRDDGSAAAKKALNDVWKRIRQQRKTALRDIGITVNIEPSRLTDDKFQAMLLENVKLISTIPDEFFRDLEGTVNRAIVKGLDRAQMRDELFARFSPPSEKGWSETRWYKHCRFIARDQTSKAVQALAECTDRDLGLTEGIWVHMPGRFTSRVTHIAMGHDKTPFKLDEGKYDPAVGKKVKPAELYGCMCTYRTVIPDTWRA